MEEITETKMTHGAHDLIAVARQKGEKQDAKELHQKIEKLQGVKDLTSITNIKDEFLKNLLSKQ